MVDFDLRNRLSLHSAAVRLRAQHDTYRQLNGRASTFGLTQAFTEYYGTARVSIPVTLVLKGGGAKNHEPDTAISYTNSPAWVRTRACATTIATVPATMPACITISNFA